MAPDHSTNVTSEESATKISFRVRHDGGAHDEIHTSTTAETTVPGLKDLVTFDESMYPVSAVEHRLHDSDSDEDDEIVVWLTCQGCARWGCDPDRGSGGSFLSG